MNYAKIKKCDVANGTGVRVSLFVSGCTHHCKNCFNKEAWDFNYGQEFTKKEEDMILEDLKPDYIYGLSLLGGEPFEYPNQQGLAPFVKRVKEEYPEKKIWCYTGYKFDDDIIKQMVPKYECTKELLRNIDYLVDGEFVEELKSPKLKFKGSSNQRIIDVQKSLQEKKIVLWEGDKDNHI